MYVERAHIRPLSAHFESCNTILCLKIFSGAKFVVPLRPISGEQAIQLNRILARQTTHY